MSRAASPDDVGEICLALPLVELGTSWGDRPTFTVGPPGKGKGFCLYRAPHKTAVDPETGEMWDDLLVISVPDEPTKRALVETDGPFFTIPHFDGTDAVLVRLSRIGEISRDQLEEILIEAWASKAPAALARQFFDALPSR